MINQISIGTSIKGDVVSDGDMVVDGTIVGNLMVKGKLSVGESGYINGTVSAQDAEIAGKLEGNVRVNDLLALLRTCDLRGDIVISRLSIEPGANFSGNCSMGTDDRAEQGGQTPVEQ